MIWPFSRSIARQREQLLELRLEDLRAQLKDVSAREVYWRTRYELIADELLFAKGAIAAPVHVERTVHVKDNLQQRVMRAANVAGSSRGIEFPRGKTDGSELSRLG